jgi:hypothetical protein
MNTRLVDNPLSPQLRDDEHFTQQNNNFTFSRGWAKITNMIAIMFLREYLIKEDFILR